jgi:hypothetical protein
MLRRSCSRARSHRSRRSGRQLHEVHGISRAGPVFVELERLNERDGEMGLIARAHRIGRVADVAVKVEHVPLQRDIHFKGPTEGR